MFTALVKNQYIGKSKLDFQKDGKPLNPTTLIGNIKGIENTLPISKYDYDYMIIGEIKDINTIELNFNHDSDSTVAICITGIPKKWPLAKFKYSDNIWESFYEDNIRGYLFQVRKLKYVL